MSNAAMIEALGKLETTQLLRVDESPPGQHLPGQLVGAAEWDDWLEEDEDVRLIAFNKVFRVGDCIASTAPHAPPGRCLRIRLTTGPTSGVPATLYVVLSRRHADVEIDG